MNNEQRTLNAEHRMGGLLALLAVLALLACPAMAQQLQYETKSFTNFAFPTTYYSTSSYTNNGTNWFYSGGNQGQPVIGAAGIQITSIWQSTYYAPNSNCVPMFIGDKWLPTTPVDLQMGVWTPLVAGQTNGFFTNYLALSPDQNYWTPSNYIQIGGQVVGGITNWFDVLQPYYTNMEWAAWDGVWTSSTNPVYVVGWRYHVLHTKF
jgi:hypothetical protein